MSPELLDPEVEDHRRTVYSDCYALGMVIYEVLSERTPFYQFYQCSNMAISWKILKGARPGRPEGAEGGWFTDDVWEVLGRCWASRPRDRPSVEDILQYLEKVSRSWTPALVPPMAAGSLTQEYSDITILEGSNVRATLPPSEVVLHQPPVKLGLEEVAGIVDGVRLTCPRRALVFTRCSTRLHLTTSWNIHISVQVIHRPCRACWERHPYLRTIRCSSHVAPPEQNGSTTLTPNMIPSPYVIVHGSTVSSSPMDVLSWHPFTTPSTSTPPIRAS